MNGPDHYRWAEALLADADYWHGQCEEGGSETAMRGVELIVARAQVHATLATAAAVALGLHNEMPNFAGVGRWADALGRRAQ